MALNLNKNLKLYYSIKEVGEMFGLNESTLRYWEQEFPFLKPKTTGAAKIRQYQEKDIEQIRLIHNLVKVRVQHITSFRERKAPVDSIRFSASAASRRSKPALPRGRSHRPP